MAGKTLRNSKGKFAGSTRGWGAGGKGSGGFSAKSKSVAGKAAKSVRRSFRALGPQAKGAVIGGAIGLVAGRPVAGVATGIIVGGGIARNARSRR